MTETKASVHRWDMLSDEVLRQAFVGWLRYYEYETLDDTGRWERLSVEAVDVLCEHYWLQFRAGLEIESK